WPSWPPRVRRPPRGGAKILRGWCAPGATLSSHTRLVVSWRGHEGPGEECVGIRRSDQGGVPVLARERAGRGRSRGADLPARRGGTAEARAGGERRRAGGLAAAGRVAPGHGGAGDTDPRLRRVLEGSGSPRHGSGGQEGVVREPDDSREAH